MFIKKRAGSTSTHLQADNSLTLSHIETPDLLQGLKAVGPGTGSAAFLI